VVGRREGPPHADTNAATRDQPPAPLRDVRCCACALPPWRLAGGAAGEEGACPCRAEEPTRGACVAGSAPEASLGDIDVATDAPEWSLSESPVASSNRARLDASSSGELLRSE